MSVKREYVIPVLFGMVGLAVWMVTDFSVVEKISLLVLLFSAIMDFRTGFVNTTVIFCGVAAVFLINAPEYPSYDAFTNHTLLLALTAIAFRFASFFLEDKIGEGDVDIMTLILFSSGFAGFAKCLFYTCIIGTAYALVKRIKLKTPIPLAPLFYFGYMTALLL